jgi:hypothetical protein
LLRLEHFPQDAEHGRRRFVVDAPEPFDQAHPVHRADLIENERLSPNRAGAGERIVNHHRPAQQAGAVPALLCPAGGAEGRGGNDFVIVLRGAEG